MVLVLGHIVIIMIHCVFGTPIIQTFLADTFVVSMRSRRCSLRHTAIVTRIRLEPTKLGYDVLLVLHDFGIDSFVSQHRQPNQQCVML